MSLALENPGIWNYAKRWSSMFRT